MIAEALKYLDEKQDKAATPKTIFESRETKMVLLPDGTVSKFSKDLPSRSHAAETLADLVALANRFGEESESCPVVWFDEDGVELVINDDGHRNNGVHLSLDKSGLFKAIAALDPRTWYPHKEFMRLLRVDLYGALEPQKLLNLVRKVQFDAGSTTRIENTRVKESMGKEISASVSAASELPEYVTLQTRMYTNTGVETEVTIKAAVEVDPNRQAFQLVVLPDELKKAKEHVMRALADTLGGILSPEIPAYQGRPEI